MNSRKGEGKKISFSNLMFGLIGSIAGAAIMLIPWMIDRHDRLGEVKKGQEQKSFFNIRQSKQNLHKVRL